MITLFLLTVFLLFVVMFWGAVFIKTVEGISILFNKIKNSKKADEIHTNVNEYFNERERKINSGEVRSFEQVLDDMDAKNKEKIRIRKEKKQIKKQAKREKKQAKKGK